MYILFSGHRDRYTDEAFLEQIAGKYPGAVWIHGGAAGFDSQVEAFARLRGIETEIFRPDYSTHGPKAAPLIRNREMIKRADLVIVCYDGRKTGGTLYTFREAKKREKEVIQAPSRRHISKRSG